MTQSGVHTGSAETVLPPAHRSDPDICRAPSAIIPATRALSSHRSSPTLHRVEKLFNIGRESFSLLTGVAIPSHKLSNDDYIDHRPRRTDVLESSANQSSLPSQVLLLHLIGEIANIGFPVAPPARQGQGLGNRPSMSHQMFAYGDTETAAVSNVFPLVTETQQSSPARAKSSLSARPDSGSSSPSVSSTRSSSPGSLSPSEVAVPSGMSYASSLPHLPPMSPIEMPSLQQQESDQQQSFIDFFSSSSPLHPQHDLSTLFARRPSAPVILPSSINFTPSNSHLDDLPSMVFAPPSPTSASNDRPTSPADSRPSSSLSTYSDVSAMIFAPGSPTSGPRTFPRPSPSRPPVPSYSPPEPAPPSPACSDVTATLKPPVPTTAKPLFEKRGRRVRLQKRSVSSSPQPPLTRLKVPLPPTTNTLHADERADLIRRNRKLVQLLGQTPGAEKETEVEEPRLFRMLPQPAFSALLGSAKQKHNHRHAMSVSVAVKSLKGEQSPTWNVLDCPPSPSGRRHSTPYTPRGFAFYLDGSLDSRNHDHHGPQHHWNLSGCPTSFIDLSDEELPHDSSEVISIETPSTANGCRNHSSSASSLVESFSPEEQAEAERRRKRDKLAKLHRFLGSRVPTDLVVGNIAGPSLPPASMPEDARDMWLYRRMSSASALSFERVKEELGEEEKAVNVKRAQKMEKVLVSFVVRCLKRLSFQQLFGMPPPQTLYHTRHAPATVARSQPTSPVSSIMAPHYISVDDPELPRRNPNQSAYTKGKKTHRPRTSESTTFLLPTKSPNSPSSPESSQSGFLDVLTQSSVYMHYQHSIASLTDIIDRVSNRKHESLPRYSRFSSG